MFGFGNKYYANLYKNDEKYKDVRFKPLGIRSCNKYEDFYLDKTYFTSYRSASPNWTSPSKVPRYWTSPSKVPRSIEKLSKKITERYKVTATSSTKDLPNPLSDLNKKPQNYFNTPSPVKRSRKEYKTGNYEAEAQIKRIQSKEQAARFANMTKEERVIFSQKMKARHARLAKKAKRRRTLFANTTISSSSTNETVKEHESPLKRPKPTSTQLNTSFNYDDQNIVDESKQSNTSFDSDDQDHGKNNA